MQSSNSTKKSPSALFRSYNCQKCARLVEFQTWPAKGLYFTNQPVTCLYYLEVCKSYPPNLRAFGCQPCFFSFCPKVGSCPFVLWHLTLRDGALAEEKMQVVTAIHWQECCMFENGRLGILRSYSYKVNKCSRIFNDPCQNCTFTFFGIDLPTPHR